MAKRSTPTERRPANLTAQQMREAIPKLKRRVDELRAVKIEDLREDSYRQVLDSLKVKINATLVDIFAADTIELKQHHVLQLDDTALFVGGVPFHRHLTGIRQGIDRVASNLQTRIDIFEETLGDGAEATSVRVVRAYEGLDLHPAIAEASSQLYLDCHYANAVEAAVKKLNNLVRLKSDLMEDGTTLMQKAFSAKKPVLRFNDGQGQSDEDEQQGFMYLFSGAVMGLRNPRAHEFIEDDPERALEFIAFVSLLAKLLDKSKKA